MAEYTPAGTYNDAAMRAEDKAKIDALKYQWEQASKAGNQAGMDAAHSAAEGLRSQYKYSGGGDGSMFVPLENKDNEPVPNNILSASSQEAYINELQKAQQEAALQALKSAYDRNVIDMDAQASKLPATYQAARNQSSAAAEQNRAGFNEHAAAYGLNSGAGGQADLAMRNQNMANMSAINQQEAAAVNDLDIMRLKVSTQYQNDIAQAIADGNMQKAQLLYQEAVRVDESLVAQSKAQADEDYRYWTSQQQAKDDQYKMQYAKASDMAAYGDFSGFLELGYTQEMVDQMYRVWAVQNPLLAQAAKGYSGNFNYGGGGGNITSPPKDDTKKDSAGSGSSKFSDSYIYGSDGGTTGVYVRGAGMLPAHIVEQYINQGRVAQKRDSNGKVYFVMR